MNSQTFKARVALGSWATTPLFDGVPRAADIIRTAMRDEPEEDPAEQNQGDYYDEYA